jgi:transposase InsO family protein
MSLRSELEKLKYEPLRTDGTNYLQWATLTEDHLISQGWEVCIQNDFEFEDSDSNKLNARALIFIKKHMECGLKTQYLTTRITSELWTSLKTRFGDLQTVIWPRTQLDWTSLRFTNFKSVSDFNQSLMDITQRAKACGKAALVDDFALIDKTLSTFPIEHTNLALQYRNLGFTTYEKLLSRLLADEQQQKIILANSHKVTAANDQGETHHNEDRNNTRRKKPYHKRSSGRKNTSHHSQRPNQSRSDRDKPYKPKCFRCGTVGHVKNDCKTPNHLVHAYKAYLASQDKSKESHHNDASSSEVEDNFVLHSDSSAFEVHHTDLNHDLDATCLIDCGTTNTILKDKSYFTTLTSGKVKLNTVASPFTAQAIGTAVIRLKNGTTLRISDAIFLPDARRNLLSLKDIRLNGFHISTESSKGVNIINLIGNVNGMQSVLETFPEVKNGLYLAEIALDRETNLALVPSTVWHSRLGHPSEGIFRKSLQLVKQLALPPSKNATVCTACAEGKFRLAPAPMKKDTEPLPFLARLHGDICGPIFPCSGPFRYYQVLADAATTYLYVSLLSTRNLAFARILAHMIRFRTQFPDYPIKTLRLDNAGEYTSHVFEQFCEATGIDIQYGTAHIHFQNGLAESMIKALQLIARPLLLHSHLPASCWGHAILHAGYLHNLRPKVNTNLSPYELLFGFPPRLDHLRVFGCAVYVPVPPPNRSKFGPQRQLGIYVGCVSPSIIRYLAPASGELFTARFADCIFDESKFPSLGGEDKHKNTLKRSEPSFDWPNSQALPLDPKTAELNLSVQKILDLQMIAGKLPDAFNDAAGVTKALVPILNTKTLNAPARVSTTNSTPAHVQPERRKRGRPVGSKVDKPPKKRTSESRSDNVPAPAGEIAKEPRLSEDGNASNSQGGLSDSLILHVAESLSEDTIPQSINAAKALPDWPLWKQAMLNELKSLQKRHVFSQVQELPDGFTAVGYRWVFALKRNDKGMIIRHKARLVAQGFSQRPGQDYTDTYAPVMDQTTFRFLISFSLAFELKMQMMDVVTAYLYGHLDKEIYMKAPEGLELSSYSTNFERPVVKLQRAIYGLKQAGRMWYSRLSKYLTDHGFNTNELSPCIFIKTIKQEFVLIAIYVDDLNLIGTAKAVDDAAVILKREFEMKDMGLTTHCIGLQLERLPGGVLLHQKTYTQRILKRFGMENCKSIKTPMVVRTLEPARDPFRPRSEDEQPLPTSYPYLNAIGALMYLANNTRPDISFAVNLLARYSQDPTLRHWIGIKQVFRYLKGTEDLGLYYKNGTKNINLVGYADAGYMSDPHKGRSQTGYVFLTNGTAISWRSTKQTLVATSTNHSEILALHEASRECIWLRSLFSHILKSTGLLQNSLAPTVIYEDNASALSQIHSGFIKGDRTKHIAPKFFFTSQLQGKEINVVKVNSEDNLADLLTKSLGSVKHWSLVPRLGLRRLTELSC